MTRVHALVAAIALALPAMGADPPVRVRLKIEPPHEIHAVTLNAAGEPHSCEVRDGFLIVPPDLPLPWTVAMARFEPTLFVRVDLERGKPLLLREYGELRVVLRPPPSAGEAVTACVLRSGDAAATPISALSDASGMIRFPLPAGIYAAAFVSAARATRIRSGVVIRPGEPTDGGDLAFEPSASLTLRVVDEKTRRPVRGAMVTWSPPDALNANIARLLFNRVWSSTTDRTGTVTIPSIGPPPVIGQWIVQAPGYTTTPTARVVVATAERVAAPDTLLRQDAALIVTALLPRRADAFQNASLVLAELESEDSPAFKARSHQPLRQGENKVRLASFGMKRILIESKNGKVLFFQNVDVSRSDERVVIAPLPCEIAGTVTRDAAPVEGSLVTVADRHDAHTILAKAATDADGKYRVSVFQTGEVLVYASGRAQPMLKRVNLAGDREVHVDFDLPNGGTEIVVKDADTSEPLHAYLRGQLTYGGRTRGLLFETDAAGHARISGAPEGQATLYVRAEGYRGQQVAVDVGPDAPATTVALHKGGVATGRVIDVDGTPIPGARILGGFATPIAMQNTYETATDASGNFELKNIPDAVVVAYVIAPAHALGIAPLREDQPNEIRLSPPNSGAVTLMEDSAPPKTLSLILAAPKGGAIIPYRVLHELGALNGMTPFQLLSSGADGRLVLPEFLPAGDYALFMVTPPKRPLPEQYQQIADLRVPAPTGKIIAIAK